MENKPKQFNFNTVVSFVVLAVVSWVGVSITELKNKQAAVSEDIAVMKATNPWKTEQLNRIENEQGRMRSQISDVQLELSRIKGGTAK